MSTTKHKLPTTKQGEPVMLTVDADGRLMLPTDMVKDNGLEPGEHVEVERVLFGLLLIPTRTDEEMEAF